VRTGLFYKSLIGLTACLLLSSCFLKPIRKSTNITYDAKHNLQLDVYSPRKIKEAKPVMIFIHGGSWRSGNKKLYRFFGKGWARNGVIGVIIDYRLSPLAQNEGMIKDAANAVKWVKENIKNYGGDENKIFISGHSAGAQMAALLAVNDGYFDSLGIKNPIKGAVMIDAFGLDMESYFNRYKNEGYLKIFTDDPKAWKSGSPQAFLHKEMPPFILFLGTRTYPEITKQTNEFFEQLKKYQPDAKLILNKKRRHETMIFQFAGRRNKDYNYILEFMKSKG
jgi:acetyl esterase/lipase